MRCDVFLEFEKPEAQNIRFSLNGLSRVGLQHTNALQKVLIECDLDIHQVAPRVFLQSICVL